MEVSLLSSSFLAKWFIRVASVSMKFANDFSLSEYSYIVFSWKKGRLSKSGVQRPMSSKGKLELEVNAFIYIHVCVCVCCI